jgi:hypothetical protein
MLESPAMPAVKVFKQALQDHPDARARAGVICAGFEKLSDASAKPRRAEFFRRAMSRMDALLPEYVCREVRDACACCKGGWREQLSRKFAAQHAGEPLAQQIAALAKLRHIGVLDMQLRSDGSILAGIGEQGGFPCPCPVFEGQTQTEPVSKTYCYCCAGHFRHHLQIALGLRLRTREIVSSALASANTEPCRFIFDIEMA